LLTPYTHSTVTVRLCVPSRVPSRHQLRVGSSRIQQSSQQNSNLSEYGVRSTKYERKKAKKEKEKEKPPQNPASLRLLPEAAPLTRSTDDQDLRSSARSVSAMKHDQFVTAGESIACTRDLSDSYHTVPGINPGIGRGTRLAFRVGLRGWLHWGGDCGFCDLGGSSSLVSNVIVFLAFFFGCIRWTICLMAPSSYFLFPSFLPRVPGCLLGEGSGPGGSWRILDLPYSLSSADGEFWRFFDWGPAR
jgi:hypothetical protein